MSNNLEDNNLILKMYNQLATDAYEQIILHDRIDKRIVGSQAFKERFIEMYVKLCGYRNSNNETVKVNVSIGEFGEVLLTIRSYQPNKVLNRESTEIGETKNEQIKFEIDTHQDTEYFVCTDTETTERFRPNESIVVVGNNHNKTIWFGNEQVGQILVNRNYSYSSSLLRQNTYIHNIELPIGFILQSMYPNSLFYANGGYNIERCSVSSKSVGSGIIKVASKNIDWTQSSVDRSGNMCKGKRLVDDVEWQILDTRYPNSLFGDTFARKDNITGEMSFVENFDALDEAISAYEAKYQKELQLGRRNFR